MFLWPPRVRLFAYGARDRLLWERTARDLDLADSLMLAWPHESRTVRLGMITKSIHWPAWSEKALSDVEKLMRYDLGFDGYTVTLRRLSVLGGPCTDEFRWLLRIRTQ